MLGYWPYATYKKNFNFFFYILKTQVSQLTQKNRNKSQPVVIYSEIYNKLKATKKKSNPNSSHADSKNKNKTGSNH